jgi:hypothetical protein
MKVTTANVIVCALLLGACGQKLSLTEQEKKVVNEMTSDLKSRCVGRYVIDLPGYAVPTGWVKLQGVMVEAVPKTGEQFKREMDAREAELKATKHLEGYRFLYHYGKVRAIENTRYFVSLGDHAASSDIGRTIEIYKWDRGYQLSMVIDAADNTDSEYERKTRGTPYGNAEWRINNVAQKTQLGFDLIEKLRGRPDDEIPTEPGACFFGGFLPGKAISRDEEIHSYFVLPDKPDVSFYLESFGNLGSNDTLLQRTRTSAFRDTLKAADGRLIRAESVELGGGIKADEVLMAVATTARPPVQGHLISLEANYASGARAPYLLLDFHNGYPNYLAAIDSIKQASLTEAEAVALWDAVSRTLRPRENGF